MEHLSKIFRYFYLVVGLLLNLAIFYLAFCFLGRNVSALVMFLSLIEILLLLKAEGTTVIKLFWIIIILLAPFVGGPLVAIFKYQDGKYRKARDIPREHFKAGEYIKGTLVPEAARNDIVSYLTRKRGFAAYKDPDMKFYPWGTEFFSDLFDEIKKAEHFIYIEMFIIKRGKILDELLPLLSEKASQGVDVRLLLDGTNTISRVLPGYLDTAAEHGIKCRIFEPVRPVITVRQNRRNHRKILCIDGTCAFTGGFNLADEYANIIQRFGRWKDTGIRMRGEAAKGLTSFFIEMWNADAAKEQDALIPYDILNIPVSGRTTVSDSVTAAEDAHSSESIAIPYYDGPLSDDLTAEDVYIGMLNTARNYVHIMTPYLILTDQMIHALEFAAARGVDVRIILPGIPDKAAVWWLAHTYYKELIRNGVNIYEYTPGFIHAKEFIADSKEAVIGTINLDFRSLYLHFEDAVFISDVNMAAAMEADYEDTLRECRHIGLDEYREFPFIKLFVGNFARLFAPFL